jgi:hypothetical protein
MEELIGTRIIGGVAGDIEALLNENQSAINEAYNNIGKGTKVSIGVSFSPDPKGVEARILLSFAPESAEPIKKIKAGMKRVMLENQADLPLA